MDQQESKTYLKMEQQDKTTRDNNKVKQGPLNKAK
jgi:hypothetical protein